tara:strand:- start:3 stop:437 length:435 start_codon:yes stop_codon:yes gene_type:complete
LTKKKPKEYLAFRLYIDCIPKKEGNFSQKDFNKFYENKNIKVFCDNHGIAIASYIEDECELYFLGVKNNQKRLGHGTKILENVIISSKALGTRKIFLEVNVTNEAALKLYTNAGFKRLGIRKAYYKNSFNSFDDAILMELILIS